MNKARFTLLIVTIIGLLAAAFPALADSNCDPNTDYYTLGNTQYTGGEFAAAVNSFTCMLQFRPENVAALNGRGNAYRSLGQFEQAIADYTEVIDIDENYAMAYNNRGWAFYNLSDFDSALADYTRALEIDPNLGYAYNNRGLIYQFQGENEMAAADFNRALSAESTPTKWVEYNLDLMAIGAAAEAEIQTSASTTTTITSPNVDALLSRATTAYNQRNWTLAVQEYTSVLEADPNNFTAIYYRGRSYIILDQFENALNDFNHMVELRPNFEYAYWERSVAHAELGNIEAATADANRAASLSPDHVNNFIARGTIAARSGDPETAGAEFLKLMERWETERIEAEALEIGAQSIVTMNSGRIVAIPFEGTSGQTITALAHSTEADPVIVLLGADGQPLAGDDDGCTGLDAMVTVQLPADGTYTLLISHAGGGYTGGITVSLTAAS